MNYLTYATLFFEQEFPFIKDGQRFDPRLVVKQDTEKDTSGATDVSG